MKIDLLKLKTSLDGVLDKKLVKHTTLFGQEYMDTDGVMKKRPYLTFRIEVNEDAT